MDRARLFFLVWGIANTAVQEFGMAMMDKILTGVELLRIIKSMLMNLRFAGVTSTDIDKIQLLTTAAEWQAYPFKDGDGAIVAPKELIDKLQVDLDKI